MATTPPPPKKKEEEEYQLLSFPTNEKEARRRRLAFPVHWIKILQRAISPCPKKGWEIYRGRFWSLRRRPLLFPPLPPPTIFLRLNFFFPFSALGNGRWRSAVFLPLFLPQNPPSSFFFATRRKKNFFAWLIWSGFLFLPVIFSGIFGVRIDQKRAASKKAPPQRAFVNYSVGKEV